MITQTKVFIFPFYRFFLLFFFFFSLQKLT